METAKLAGTPYDDVFRTLLNDCRALVIPLINEMFGERYSGDEKVVFSPNEHFLNRQGGDEGERITDTCFQIRGSSTKKYHLECQSNADSSMLVRFFEYDTQIALDEGNVRGDTLTVKLPHSAVLFLRHTASTPDSLKVRMETPGGTVEYGIPVMKSQKYTLEEIFEKNLLMLLPFYIFSHEARFEDYERDGEKLRGLLDEYGVLRSRLEELLQQGAISEYTKCTIIDMSNKVLRHIARKYSSVEKGVVTVMGGKVLDYEAKTILNEGRKEGRKEGREEGREEGLDKGIEGTVSILKDMGVPQETIRAKIQQQYQLTLEASKKYL